MNTLTRSFALAVLVSTTFLSGGVQAETAKPDSVAEARKNGLVPQSKCEATHEIVGGKRIPVMVCNNPNGTVSIFKR